MKKIYYILLIGLAFSACGGSQSQNESTAAMIAEPEAVKPSSDSEKEILQKVNSAKIGKTIAAGKTSFIVTDAYYAASGRECKSLEIMSSNPTTPIFRTVCKFNDTWGFAPDVLPSAN